MALNLFAVRTGKTQFNVCLSVEKWQPECYPEPFYALGRLRLTTRPVVVLFLTSVCAIYSAKADENLLPIAPVAPQQTTSENADSVQWRPLLRQSAFFLGVEHGFRAAFDKDTQAGLGGNFFTGYWKSASNLHGWADGDPFVVNYVGHPMQGAIAGDIWVHNDPHYRLAEFGANRLYWVGRMRAMGFAWAYSEQFEIGPLSEASIGHIQSRFPQQGFVDHVITPVVGVGWMVAEDVIDRYVIRNIEGRTENRWVRILARGFLNPARTFANCMQLEHPWNREISVLPKPRQPRSQDEEPPGVPKFELAINANGMPVVTNTAGVRCAGGGATATFNLTTVVGIETDVSGCKMLGLETNLSGDSLTFAVGPRFTYRGTGRWTPWVHVLVGGEKDSQEMLDPEAKKAVLASPPAGMTPHELHSLYIKDWSATSFAMQIGGGVDWALNRNFAFRLGDVDYVHELVRNDQVTRPPELKVTMGVVLRVGD
jgi:hypothetical protein